MVRRMVISVFIMTILCCTLAFFMPPIANEAVISVSLSAASVTFPESLELGLGDSFALPSGYDFLSSDERVAEVSSTGLVRARDLGACVISALAESGERVETDVTVLPAPERVELSFTDNHLGVVEKSVFVARVYLKNGENTASGFVFSSSDRSVATVSDEGVVSARKVGRAKIAVTTYNGLTAYVNITVRKKPAWIKLGEAELVLGAGEIRSVSALLPTDSAGQYTISSSDESILRAVGRNVIAVSPGIVRITARLYNGMTASCEARVCAAPEGVMLSSPNFVLGVGQRVIPSCTFTGTDAGGGVEWRVSDNSIAKVDGDGGITALSVGECDVFCVTYNGCSDAARLRVMPAPAKFKVSPGAVKLGVGEEYSVKTVIDTGSAAGISYKSSDAKIASVSAAGIVLARGRGKAIITATAHNGLKDTLTVTVKKAPGYVAFRYEPLTIYVGESAKVAIRMSNGAASVIKYSSSDRGVARISSSGRLTGISQGEATLRIETYNGLSAECDVRVYEPAIRVDAPEELDCIAGVVMKLPIAFFAESGEEYTGEIVWESDDPDIACIADGVLTPLKTGVTRITAVAHGAECFVKVNVGAYFSAMGLRVAAHRGDVSAGTENTLSAIRGAVEAGADFVEVDVRATSDGELVLMHDAGLIRIFSQTGSVAKRTLNYLKGLSVNGEMICTLDEALEYLSGTNVNMLLEIKVKGIEEACAKAVEAHGMTGRVTFISFYLDALTAIRDFQSDARVGYLYSVNIIDPAAIARNFSIDLMIPYQAYVDEDYVSRLHAAGAEVGTWTVNSAKMLARMRDAGVDLVITDTVNTALRISGGD